MTPHQVRPPDRPAARGARRWTWSLAAGLLGGVVAAWLVTRPSDPLAALRQRPAAVQAADDLDDSADNGPLLGDSPGDANVPTTAVQFLRRALDRQERGNYAGAIDDFRRSLALQPDNADAHNALGAALAATKQFDLAIEQFQTAVELRPDLAEAYVNLGTALSSRGDFAEAVPYLKQAVELKPDYAKAHNNLAVALKETGQRDEAFFHIHEANRLKRAVNDP